MGIFGKHGHREAGAGKEHEDLTQYVHDTIRHMPHDDTGGRLGEEEGAGAEIMAEALEGFEEHLHHPDWHPGKATEPPSQAAEGEGRADPS
ncbi:MAG: hypothetical protein ACLGIA_00865 [Actinomycetes bacterium]